jgi:hypothetical protein
MTTIITQSQASPTQPLPTVIANVRRVKGGYSVYNGKKWTFYARTCLSEADVNELEDWLVELEPTRKAA